MKLFLIAILFAICFFIVSCVEEGRDPPRKVSKPIWNETYTDTLKRDLLMSYDKFARPLQHYNTTKVSIDLRVKHIEFDEASSIFTVYAWIIMRWYDEKLKWNASEYGNLTKISLAQHEIWQPDITLYNSINYNDYYGSSSFNIEPNGTVLWVPPSMFKIFCDANLRYWHQLEPKEVDNHLELFVENPEWEIIDFTAKRTVTHYVCCPEQYVDVRYNITIERRASIHRTVVVAPSFVIILFTLTTFWLPTDHSQKLILNGVTTLVVCMYLIYFSQRLKAMTESTPLIVTFYSHTFFLVCLSTIIAAITINLSRIRRPQPLPWIIKKQLDGFLGDYLLLHHVVAAEIVEPIPASEMRQHPFEEHIGSDEQQIIEPSRSGPNSVRTDYLKLTTAIDRIAFLVYLLIFILFAFVYSL